MSTSYNRLNCVHGSPVPLTSEILPTSNNIIQCVILASLDNVMGPKALCIWKQSKQNLQNVDPSNHANDPRSISTDKHCAIDDEAIKYITIHTLQGELTKGITGIETKNFRTEMFIVPHQNVVANAIVFTFDDPVKSDHIGHSLSIVCKSDIWHYFLKIQYLCDVWQQRMAAKIQVLLSMVSETHLSMRHMLDRKLLECAIVSHLQTCGCSVVVGDDEQSVNLMINTLALFIQEKDLATCRHVIREKPWPYHSGLFLQGLLKDQFGEADILAQDVLHSHFPVTIVDIPQSKVRQSLNFHEHTILRHKVLRQEILNLKVNCDHQVTTPTNSLFQSVSETGMLVPELLIELSTLPPTESVLQRHIKDFYRKLEYKAIVMLNHLEFLRSKDLALNIRNMQKILGFQDNVDLQIIFSVAERLRPGIYSYIVTRGQATVI
ncbi:Guanine nucleotide exchange C9orf72 [Nymphon striatum]|nr:Guanine nucleotide exchange C9orf72 [Nymphon striatum]